MGIGSRPILDANQSYTLDSAALQNGITSLLFRRARDTNDTQDIQFNVGSSFRRSFSEVLREC